MEKASIIYFRLTFKKLNLHFERKKFECLPLRLRSGQASRAAGTDFESKKLYGLLLKEAKYVRASFAQECKHLTSIDDC